jgi:P-type Mg2+ transporter
VERSEQEFWSVSASHMLQELGTSSQGLTSEAARQALSRHGFNLLRPRKKSTATVLFLAQFKSPIIIILIFAAALAMALHDYTNGLIILGIVLISGLLGFIQERGAVNAVDRLLTIVRVRVTALRDGIPKEIPLEEIVPGDIVMLNAGDLIPGDCLVLESKDLFVDEATLTGETYPVDKSPGTVASDAPFNKRTNALFMGTHVVSGTSSTLVVRTGASTEFGKISQHMRLRSPETEFEHGIRRFGYLVMEVTLILVISIFAVNAYLQRPILEAFMFSLALAVGLTPQLLPAIISINLAHGARRMALKKVIVKRLESIENFGSMNVLCSDKTGTLTLGEIKLESALDVEGNESERALLFAYVNAFYETGFTNPIDEAIRRHKQFDVASYTKLDEVPYDFIRKRLTVLVSCEGKCLMITKGALENVIAVCSSAENHKGAVVDLASVRGQIQERFESLSRSGFRTLGIAYKNGDATCVITKDHEADMTFLGFLVFCDPPKPGIVDTISRLRELGVNLKVVTGDNRLVAANVGRQVGLSSATIMTGPEVRGISDEALMKRVNDVDILAEIEPNQKERVILALRKAGNVVGYMGDGINDASALHAADVGISVDSAADVAKEAAHIVLLEKDLGVLVEGVAEGRRTFGNTLKYVFMATSANFGNMFSMAGASLLMPFLPLVPKQILLMNLLTDFPEMAIASDSVDRELVVKPRRWDIKFIRNFMITFGLLSSIFDYLTFGALLLVMRATRDQFRTGWFLESVVSAALIVLVVRTRRPFFRSAPGRHLAAATFLIVALTLVLPFTPFGRIFGFVPLPISFILLMGMIVVLYIIGAETTKKIFYKRVRF